MSKPILVQAPSQGLNNLVPANMIADRETPLSKNVLFADGVIKTPYGFAKLASSGLPLNGGNKIIGIAPYQEKNGTGHIVVVTTDKIYQKDNANSEWDNIVINDLTDNILRANIENPVSFVAVAHTDGIGLDGGANEAFYHLLVCDGGMSPIQRWAGKFEEKFYSLAGADGYHDTDTPLVTDHYAQQVNVFYNHVILVNPKTWDAIAELFKDNPQTILWGKAGLLEGSDAFKITDTGAGYNELVDTGDSNVWTKQLGNQLIVYQKHSIWSMSHVGGTDVFRFRTEIPDLGLIAPHLLVSHGNRHYFIGHDLNIYEYSGGSYKQRIGDQVRDVLKGEIDFTYTRRCWMAMDVNGSRLWIFYVPKGQEYITKAYGVDIKTGAWMIREFSHVWTDSGITSVSIIGAQSYMIGGTYQQHTDDIEANYYSTLAVPGGETYRDTLTEVLVEERLSLGDSEGNIYQYDPDLTTDDGENVPAYFISKIFDYGLPDVYKWWQGITIIAKGGGFRMKYRTNRFETEDEGWAEDVDLEDCIVSQWKMNDSKSDTIVIDVMKLHNGTSQQNTEDVSVLGVINKAFHFNGSTDYIDTNHTFQSTLQDSFTISAWIKPDDGQSGSEQTIIGARTSFSDWLDLKIAANGQLVLSHRVDDVSVVMTSSANTFADGAESWHHIAVVVDRTTKIATLCIDGESVNTGSLASQINTFTNDRNIYIGGRNDMGVLDNQFAGDIDNVMIFDIALTADNISGLYNSGRGTEAPIINPFGYQELTDEYKPYSFFFNETSRQIQFKFCNENGSSFYIKEFKILAPTVEDEI